MQKLTVRCRVFSEMQVRVSEIQFPADAMFIRGYDTTIDFNFTLTNLESTLRIDAALAGSINYDVTVTTAHPTARKRRDVSADPATVATQTVTISNDQLMQGLNYSSSVVITGQVTTCSTCTCTCIRTCTCEWPCNILV